jgi:uncharacterized protein YjbJ (UPF0337 family)
MNVIDKARSAVGKLKEQLGKRSGNKGQHAEGRSDQAKDGMKNVRSANSRLVR